MIDQDTQRRIEQDVIAMQQMECVQRARNMAANHFCLAHGKDIPEEAKGGFEQAIDEWACNYLFKAAASDAANPRFAINFLPPHDTFGFSTPGARMGGDNPDNLYRVAGIEHGGSYRVTGRRQGTGPANVSFTLVGNYGTSVTLDGIEGSDLEYAGDGSFSFTIGASKADATGNIPHLTTKPHAKFLFVRDTLADWNTEKPLELSIERLDKIERAPKTIAEMAQSAAYRMVEDVPLYFWFHRLFSAKEINLVEVPVLSGGLGGLATQAGNQAHLYLKDGEAAVVRFNVAGAAYAAIQLTNWWFQSIDAHACFSTLTHKQAALDEKGWVECIISPKDPGFVNWVDTGGLRHVLMMGRWQGLGTFPTDEKPDMNCRIVKLDEIADCEDIAGGPINAKVRVTQLATRRSAWNARFD